MPGIRSECHILIFSLNYFHVQEKSGLLVQNHLQSFANILPNIFINGVVFFSVLLCEKEWRYHFQNHSTPNKRGRSMVTRKIEDWHLMDIHYPKPMDVYHPKDQHCVHIFQALNHWNTQTLSLWEVTWSSRVNIFASNIGHIEQII